MPNSLKNIFSNLQKDVTIRIQMSGLARERGTGNMNDVLIIGIAGGSGSGKTTLTNQIAS